MTHDFTPELPEIIPESNIFVEDEQHRYQTFEGDSGSVIEQTEYTLNKAPVDEITEVTGIVDNSSVTFTAGTDYSLEDLVRDRTDKFTFTDSDRKYELQHDPDSGSTSVTDNSGDSFTEGTDYEITNPDGIRKDTLEWLDGGSTPDDDEDFTVDYTVTHTDSIIEWDTSNRTPDAGSLFYVSYRCESVISRYIDANDNELESLDNQLESIINAKFVDKASGEELDQLGRLFGALGKREGRSDSDYRKYLKSVVQSFVSRGTVSGIKVAVSAATGVPVEDVSIEEDFQNNEYDVVLVPSDTIVGSIVEEVADIADPSGVEQNKTIFDAATDGTGINDAVSSTEGNQISDELVVDDANTVDGNKTTSSEDILSDDTSTVDGNKTTANEDTQIDDSNTVETATVTWGTDWETMGWG